VGEPRQLPPQSECEEHVYLGDDVKCVACGKVDKTRAEKPKTATETIVDLFGLNTADIAETEAEIKRAPNMQEKVRAQAKGAGKLIFNALTAKKSVLDLLGDDD
jgi:hypothetical protein